MKRFLSAFAMTLAFASTVSAQEIVDTKPMWGLRAAFDVNLPGKYHGDSGSVKMFNHGYGFTLGGVCNLYLKNGFYLEPGVSFFYDSYKADFVIGNGDGFSTEEPLLQKMGLRVPLMVGYEFNIAGRFPIDVYTGPELSYAFSGDIKVKGEYDKEDFDTDPFSFQRRVDCAWKVGIGFPTGPLMISVDAAFGLTDLLKTDMSFRENRISVGASYYF